MSIAANAEHILFNTFFIFTGSGFPEYAVTQSILESKFISASACETNSLTNSELLVPIMNYKVKNIKPYKIEMEFKINPKLLEFQGINKQYTQIEHFGKVKTYYEPDGTIKIIGWNYHHTIMEGDVLVYLDLKAIQKKVNTTLDFQKCNIDGILMRTMSATIVADAAGMSPYSFTKINTQQESSAMNVFPNPAKNYVNVEIGNISTAATLQIINVAGQVIYSETIAAQDVKTIHTIDVSQFIEGLYIINLRHENEISVEKFAVH